MSKEDQTSRIETNKTTFLIESSGTKSPISRDELWSVQSVDYENHPAYSGMFNVSLQKRLHALMVFTKRLILLAKRLINYEFIPLEYRKPETLSQKMGFFLLALKNIIKKGSSNSKI